MSTSFTDHVGPQRLSRWLTRPRDHEYSEGTACLRYSISTCIRALVQSRLRRRNSLSQGQCRTRDVGHLLSSKIFNMACAASSITSSLDYEWRELVLCDHFESFLILFFSPRNKRLEIKNLRRLFISGSIQMIVCHIKFY